MDFRLQALSRLAPSTRSAARLLPSVPQQLGQIDALGQVAVLIESRIPQQTADHVIQMGYTAQVLNARFLKARLPHEHLVTLAQRAEVLRLQAAQRLHLTLAQALPSGGVDKVHRAEGLHTPFTGKGVVIGIIDQGFEYHHPAFLNADKSQSRLRAVWDRTIPDSQPTTDIPQGGDERSRGHGTHVAGIAAGREIVAGIRGVASDAELIFIPSSLNSDEVVEEVKYIKNFAEAEQKRWIVNMSFGSQIGPHDGTQAYDQIVDELLGDKGFVTASMGNDSQERLHVSALLQPGETRYVVYDFPATRAAAPEPFVIADFWSNSKDSLRHFNITPWVYTKQQLKTINEEQWQRIGQWGEEINAYNRKQNFTVYAKKAELVEEFADSACKLVLQITLRLSAEQAQSFHLWTNRGHGRVSEETIQGRSHLCLAGDNRYLVGEGSATVPRAFAVGSYNTALKVDNVKDGFTIDYSQVDFSPGKLNERSSFSNIGPFLDERYPKPAVLAPGAVLVSAISKLGNLDTSARDITHRVEHEGEAFYYAANLGTSMATPYFAGVLALWLEAYPQLSYDEVMTVLRKSSRRAVGVPEYTPENGYGHIDAYEGLKEVLNLASHSTIVQQHNSTSPITLHHVNRMCRLLFNTSESFAQIRLFDLVGQSIWTRSLRHIRAGHEETFNLQHLPSGVYLLNVLTAASQKTFRIVLQ